MSLIVAAGILFLVGVLLLLHHGWKHSREDPANSLAQRESCLAVCYFQPANPQTSVTSRRAATKCGLSSFSRSRLYLLFIRTRFRNLYAVLTGKPEFT